MRIIVLPAARDDLRDIWRFTGGSHLAGQGGTEAPDATPDRQFDRFGDFFGIDPRVRSR